jgi:bacteriorhodopsin
MKTNAMYNSLLISVIIQVITGLIEVSALFIPVSAPYVFLKQMMVLELAVQIIEGTFYTYWLYNFKNIKNVTPTRYIDWSITTPTMLINLIMYLNFLRYKNTQLDFFQVFNKELYTIFPVLLLNWVMLLFGYLSEKFVLPTSTAVTLGFIPFVVYYYIIYEKYAKFTTEGVAIFNYFLFFWSLYGVAAYFPYNLKSTFYNILDLFSKNFFGIFLFYIIYTNKQ